MTTSVAILIAAKYNTEQYHQLIDAALGNVDEILVAIDLNPDPDIDGYRAKDGVVYFQRPLGTDLFPPDFSAQRNFLALQAKSDWLLAMDTDENLDPWLWGQLRLIADSTVEETISLPCRNHLVGMQDYVAWPDYHVRWYQRNHRIRWTRAIHTYLTGYATSRLLPPQLLYAIQHTKTREMCERTNKFNAAHPLPA